MTDTVPSDTPPATAETLLVYAETADVTKRTVETGRIVIQKTVSEHDSVVDALLDRTDVTVERVPIGRIVTEAPAARQQGDTWIIPVLEETLVVEKRLILKEELHVRSSTRQEVVQQTVRLRTEHVDIQDAAATHNEGV